MIKIESENDLLSISRNVSLPLYQFICSWYHVRENADKYQDSLYCSPLPVGSMGPMWIAETQTDIEGKKFVELIQYIINSEILFVGVYLPPNGEENADIFIPGRILSAAELQNYIHQSDSIERINTRC